MLVGIVKSKRDVKGESDLTVLPEGLTDIDSNYEKVKYTSFYAGGPYAGAGFVPEYNTKILYDTAQNEDKPIFYYVASIIHPSLEVPQIQAITATDDNEEFGPVQTSPWSKDDTQSLDQSMDYGITSPLGNAILLRDQRNSEEGTDNKGVVIKAGKGGHELHLDNSSKSSGVKLHSAGQGAALNMSSDDSKDGKLGPAGAQLRARRNLSLTSAEGDINTTIADGGNISIINRSTGSKSSGPFTEHKSGTVKIESVNGDIHIICTGNGIFIDAVGQTKLDGTTGPSVQIRSKNKIALFSENGIDLKSAGDINIKGRNVNLQSETLLGGKINLNPLTPLDPFMGIRKTKFEIVAERMFLYWPFFFNPVFTPNYVMGSNKNMGGPTV